MVDDDNSKEWTMYDAGPKTVKCPLFCFPPASGTGDVFFKQILGLTSAGYRVIAVSYTIRQNVSFDPVLKVYLHRLWEISFFHIWPFQSWDFFVCFFCLNLHGCVCVCVCVYVCLGGALILCAVHLC